MANSNFIVQNGLQVGPTTIWAGNGAIISTSTAPTNLSSNLNITAGNITVSTDATAQSYVVSAGLTDSLFTAAKTINSFVQVAAHNGSNGGSASSDFIAYADTGTNDQGFIDMGIASTGFNDPAYFVTKPGDGYLFVSGPPSTGGNLIIATGDGTVGDIVFTAGGFTASGTVQARIKNGNGLVVTGNVISSTGAVYQGPNAFNVTSDQTFTTTLNGAITNSQTNIRVASTTNFFPAGLLTIGTEQIKYTSANATYFINCTRGFNSTTAASALNAASVSQTQYGASNESAIFTGNVNAFAQVALKNLNNGSAASTDMIVYASNGDNNNGWMDMGITSGTFNDTNYGVTGPDDGYMFMSAPLGATGNGSMFISTSNNGAQNDIVFSTNGFQYGTERMRIVGVSRAGRPAGVEVNIATTSTSTTTGALRVNGGIGLTGNLYVGGNVNIVGNISFGGAGTTVSSQTLTVENPISFLANSNPSNSQDIGVVGIYKLGATTNYTGVVKEAASGYWRVFDNLTTLPTTTVSWAGTTATGLYAGNITLANSTASTNTTSGALQVRGGAGISGAIYNGGVLVSGGNIVAASGTASTSTTTGALVVTGGVGVSGATYLGANLTITGSILPSANVTYNIGSTTGWFNVFYGKATQAQYADLAENYQADSPYQFGTVLMFGGAKEVTLASADTTAVAGVVSQNPAHLMNGALTGPNVVPVALTGRVPCNVVGPIKKGDLMVSAGFGFAKANNSAGTGQVIGKALADFPAGSKGQIEVVVGRV